jgi:hypothetical protein
MEFTTLENAPVLPAECVLGEKEYTIENDICTTVWGKDKAVRRYYKNGMTKIWWAKPTLKDAVTLKDTGIFIQFHSSDEVTARYNGINYYWSAPRETYPILDIESYMSKLYVNYDEYDYVE